MKNVEIQKISLNPIRINQINSNHLYFCLLSNFINYCIQNYIHMLKLIGDLSAEFDAEFEKIKKMSRNALQRAGEKYVETARDASLKLGKDYQDHTTNLRNANSYIIKENGLIVDEAGEAIELAGLSGLGDRAVPNFLADHPEPRQDDPHLLVRCWLHLNPSWIPQGASGWPHRTRKSSR